MKTKSHNCKVNSVFSSGFSQIRERFSLQDSIIRKKEENKYIIQEKKAYPFFSLFFVLFLLFSLFVKRSLLSLSSVPFNSSFSRLSVPLLCFLGTFPCDGPF